MAAHKPGATFVIPTAVPPVPRSYWVVESAFLAGAYPGSPDRAKHHERICELWNAGLRTFVNLVEESETNNTGQPFQRYDDVLRQLAEQTREQVAHLRFPVPDLGAPSLDRMRSILDGIDLSLSASRPVYLHCFGGVGRTGTVVCCWLLRHGFAARQDAVSTLRNLRQADVATKDRNAPETHKQIRFVENWPEARA